MPRKYLQALILIIITYNCVYSSVNYFADSFNTPSHDQGNRKMEERLQNLRDLIPLERGEIGYFSNEQISSVGYDAANESGEYVITQYILSPLILDKGKYHEWNILNMSEEAYQIWSKDNSGEFKLLASNGGFYLVQRRSE